MSNKRSILIFPINSSAASEYSKIATELGFHVIEASSEFDADIIARGNVEYLPYVSEPSFNIAFENLREKENIGLIYTPHPAVWNYLTELSRQAPISTRFNVCNPPPFNSEWNSYKEAYKFGSQCAEKNRVLLTAKDVLPVHYYANLHKNYHQIPGQCDDQKLMLLAQIAPQAPEGDIVEIGSLYGRSAFALAWLSKQYSIGSVICVDPWRIANISDQGSDASLVNSIVNSYDWDKVFSAFVVSVAALDNINYLREPSAQAKQKYVQAATCAGAITSDELGTTQIKGRISILHIDGNHKYEEVKQDVEQWLPMIIRGGWLLLDDYVWAFGDGPRRVGDELLQTLQLKQSYVSGDTLCLQLE